MKKSKQCSFRAFMNIWGGVILVLIALIFASCNTDGEIGEQPGNGSNDTPTVEDYTYNESTNTYMVYTADGLLAWNEAAQGDLTLNCTLAANIDLTGIEYEWLLVGNQSTPYTGTFEGGNNTITGLTINQSSTSYVGLIGYLGSGGKVQNLTLYNVNITGYNYVGGVVGWNNGGTVTACAVSGNVSGNRFIGGVVGNNSYYGTVTACTASGNVSGDRYIGGVVGSNSSYGTVTACTASGNVSGNSEVGGVAGYNGGTVTACYALGSVTSSGDRVGGVVGYNYYGTVTACYSTSTVSGSSSVGGVVGYIYSGTVTTCYWSSDISDGIGNGSGEVTKVDDGDWSAAVNTMNSALASNDWKYEILTGSLPTLTKNQ